VQSFTKDAEIFLMLGLISALFLFSPPLALGQGYPDKPINIYCGYQPGATTDLTARALAAGAERRCQKKYWSDAPLHFTPFRSVLRDRARRKTSLPQCAVSTSFV